MADSYRYGPDSLRKAKAIYALLAERVRRGDLSTLTYGQVAKIVGGHVRPLKFPLAKIQDECRAAQRPTITVLIVDQRTRMPNEGCDAFGSSAVLGEIERVKKTDWPAQAWW